MTLDSTRPAALDGPVQQHLTFVLGDEEYGIPILRVQEIRGASSITPIPNAAEFVLGVVNLRGDVVPILDLRRRFGMPALESEAPGVSIIVTQDSRVIGLMVDAVSDVLDVDAEAVTPIPELTASADRSFLSGMAQRDDGLVLLLDIDAVLAESAPLPGDAAGDENL